MVRCDRRNPSPPQRSRRSAALLPDLASWRSSADFFGTYAVDLTAMLFAFPMAIFPFLADDLGAPRALGHGGPSRAHEAWGSTRHCPPGPAWSA
ncbi:hypothetical protein [Streptomyces sp. Ac-502]|uniref:hypothetical protein n=1 Tax=Streptomyces sp. Ac-502 TaxID=3342801 RepID=UPI003862C52C